MSCPSHRIRPALGRSSRLSRRMRVDFPQPLSPTTAKLSPLAMSKVTLRTARNAPVPAKVPRSRTR